MTPLPGGRADRQGKLRLLVPPTFTIPTGASHEVKNGRRIFHLTASGAWSVRDGYLQSRVESPTLQSSMLKGFSVARKLKEVNHKELIYVSASNGRTRVEYRGD